MVFPTGKENIKGLLKTSNNLQYTRRQVTKICEQLKYVKIYN